MYYQTTSNIIAPPVQVQVKQLRQYFTGVSGNSINIANVILGVNLINVNKVRESRDSQLSCLWQFLADILVEYSCPIYYNSKKLLNLLL